MHGYIMEDGCFKRFSYKSRSVHSCDCVSMFAMDRYSIPKLPIHCPLMKKCYVWKVLQVYIIYNMN